LRYLPGAGSTAETRSVPVATSGLGASLYAAKRKDLSKTAVIRQALRRYQLIDARTALGEKLIFEDDKLQKKAEVMVL